MAVNKIDNSCNSAKFNLPTVENYAAPKPINYDDFKSRAIREDRQLRNMLGNEMIDEIRKIDNYHYLIVTNGGHEIPVEVRGVPYGREPRFLHLDWNGGVFAMYTDMG